DVDAENIVGDLAYHREGAIADRFFYFIEIFGGKAYDDPRRRFAEKKRRVRKAAAFKRNFRADAFAAERRKTAFCKRDRQTAFRTIVCGVNQHLVRKVAACFLNFQFE